MMPGIFGSSDHSRTPVSLRPVIGSAGTSLRSWSWAHRGRDPEKSIFDLPTGPDHIVLHQKNIEAGCASECMLKCARKLLDTADIVRDAIFRQSEQPCSQQTDALIDNRHISNCSLRWSS
jgi:hypothetical protein